MRNIILVLMATLLSLSCKVEGELRVESTKDYNDRKTILPKEDLLCIHMETDMKLDRNTGEVFSVLVSEVITDCDKLPGPEGA